MGGVLTLGLFGYHVIVEHQPGGFDAAGGWLGVSAVVGAVAVVMIVAAVAAVDDVMLASTLPSVATVVGVGIGFAVGAGGHRHPSPTDLTTLLWAGGFGAGSGIGVVALVWCAGRARALVTGDPHSTRRPAVIEDPDSFEYHGEATR